jgi:hypothetical protein
MRTISVKIKFCAHYKILVSIDDIDLLARCKDHFVTFDEVAYQAGKGGRRRLRFEHKASNLWTKASETSLFLDAGLVDYVSAWLGKIDKKEFRIELEINLPKVQPVQLSQKWLGILRPEQIEDVLKLTSTYGAMAAQHTGFGKSLCLLAIVDCLPGRCLILVPSRSILEEIQLRAEEFGMEIPEYDWTAPINVLNPVGFLRSNEAKNPEAQKWLQEVDYALTDEAHHLQATSWANTFDNYLENVRRSYGFSASPDAQKGALLSPKEVEIHKLGARSAKILGFSGTTRIVRKSKTEVTLVEVRTRISNLVELEDVDTWMEYLSHMMTQRKLAKVIAHVVNEFPDVKFYLPVHSINAGLTLYENLAELKVPGIFWCAEFVVPENIPAKKGEKLLATVKRELRKKKCRFLMTTSLGFEGIDIKELSGIIPLVGKSYRMVMQPAGRSSRGGTLVYVLINDNNNYTMVAQTNERRSRITQEYKVVDTITFNI